MEKDKSQIITQDLIFILKYGKITEDNIDFIIDISNNRKQLSNLIRFFC